MPDKKLSSKSGRPSRFDIDVDATRLVDFPDQRPISIQLSDDAVGKYDVYQKDIPASVKGKKLPNGNSIRWLNNYGLKLKDQENYQLTIPLNTYIIILDKVDGVQYVYHDPQKGSIQPLPISPYPDDPSKVQASLPLGDPAIGMG